MGVRPHHVIASVLDGPEAATAALAVSEVAAFAPLDPKLTRQQYEAQFFELTPRVVLLPAGKPHPARGAARDFSIPVVEVLPRPAAGEFSICGAGQADGSYETSASTEDIALIIPVSGNRFAPITHANLQAAIVSLARGGRCCLNLGPLHGWRGLVQGCFAPLSAGATVAFPGADCDPDQICLAHPAQAEAPVIACNQLAFYEGELAARGAAVINAYFRNPAATRDAFRDGWFFISGRAEPIRSGHIEISPLDVDAALLLHPDVADAVTFPAPDAKFGAIAVSAVVLRSGARAGAAELKRFAAMHVRYGPQRIVVVPAMPEVSRSRMAEALGLCWSGRCAEVIPFRPHGPGVPLFIVNPPADLRVEAGRATFGIRAPDLAHLPPPHTIEHIAAECIRAMRRVRPEGPYALAGGDVAIEMARQLEQDGALVEFVAVLEPRRKRWLQRMSDFLLGTAPQIRYDRPHAWAGSVVYAEAPELLPAVALRP
jgi:hypothetical protein